MNKLAPDKRAAIIRALTEGCGVRATARICGVSKLTVTRLLCDVGRLCADYHDVAVRGLGCKRVQVDESWSFIGCKERSKKLGASGHGDAW